MAASIIGFPGEPLVVTRMSLPLHEYWNDIRVVNRRINKLLAEYGAPFYRIYDAQTIFHLDYSDIVLWIAEEQEHYGGSMFDPRVRALIAGDSPMIHLAAKKIQGSARWPISVVPTLEDALACARAQIRGLSVPGKCVSVESGV